jgi:hypothetical protein
VHDVVGLQADLFKHNESPVQGYSITKVGIISMVATCTESCASAEFLTLCQPRAALNRK